MGQLITYANDDPQKEVAVERYVPDGLNYYKDGVSGAGYVEIVMTKLVDQMSQQHKVVTS